MARSINAAEELRRRELVEMAEEAARESVELVPGRAAASVEFDAEEIDALKAIVMEGVNRKTGEYRRRLDRQGVAFTTWHRILVKINHAGRELDRAARPEL